MASSERAACDSPTARRRTVPEILEVVQFSALLIFEPGVSDEYRPGSRSMKATRDVKAHLHGTVRGDVGHQLKAGRALSRHFLSPGRTPSSHTVPQYSQAWWPAASPARLGVR